MGPTGNFTWGIYLALWKIGLNFRMSIAVFCVVDWHALTTAYEDTEDIRDNVKEMVIDWLSCGIDPEKSVIFKQSDR